jgi:hippurate hydrolase
MPGMPVGTVSLREGPAMAAFDIFEIVITGKGAHAAMPQLGIDPVVTGAQIVTALQTIASRRTDPNDPVVVSVTQFHAGDTWNVIPETAVIRGTVRSFRKETQDRIESDIGRIARAHCESQGATMTLRYERRYPALVNSPAETGIAAGVAAKVVGAAKVMLGAEPLMGSEDFAYMLQARPGCYVWLGNGMEGGPGGCSVHNPHYDFNDDIAVIGASYWATLVEYTLSKAS